MCQNFFTVKQIEVRFSKKFITTCYIVIFYYHRPINFYDRQAVRRSPIDRVFDPTARRRKIFPMTGKLYRMRVAGFSIWDFRFRISDWNELQKLCGPVDARCLSASGGFDTRPLSLVTGHWSLVTGHWLLVSNMAGGGDFVVELAFGLHHLLLVFKPLLFFKFFQGFAVFHDGN